MFFNSIKEINRLRKEINRLLREGIFLMPLREINRFRNEVNRLLSKGMSNIYLKVTIETFSKLQFSGFEKFGLNFKASCCLVVSSCLGAKLYVIFLLL